MVFLSGPQGSNGWYTGPVQVTLIATDIDGPSDIAATSYRLDDGPATSYTSPFTVSGMGSHTIIFGSVDQSLNAEVPLKSVSFTIVGPQIALPADLRVAPAQFISIPVTLSPAAGVSGVAVALTSSDPFVATVTPSVVVPAGATTPDRRGAVVTGMKFGQATITASAPGYSPASQTVTVTLTQSFSPSSLTLTGTGMQARPLLTLSAPTPSSGLTVNLTSDNPKVATVPASVFIPAGGLTVGVPVTPVGMGTATIRASISPFVTDATVSVTVKPGP